MKVEINRDLLTLQEANRKYGYCGNGEQQEDRGRASKFSITRPCFTNINKVKQCFPILDWLPNYPWKKFLIGDILAGLSSGILQIPLGMGFASLARLPPFYGIITGIFPGIIYMILGSCAHVALGAFPVIYIMVGEVVKNVELKFQSNSTSDLSAVPKEVINPVTISATLAFLVGCIQMILRLLSFGSLTVLLSDSMVSGFTTGAAIHVVISQLKHVLGVPSQNLSGIGGKIQELYAIILSTKRSNIQAVMLSTVSFTYLLLCLYVIKPLIAKVTSIPFPSELILMIIMTGVSYSYDLAKRFDVQVIGFIQSGLPPPTLPALELTKELAYDSLVIGIVSYVILYSMAKTYAKSCGKDVDGNQELLASVFANIFSSFFLCGPVCDVPARSLTKISVGGNTPLCNLVCSLVLIIVILFLGPMFQALPYAVLAPIVIVALKGLLRQVFDLKTYWHNSKQDIAIWMTTVVAVIYLDIELGLLVGVIVSLLSIIYRAVRPYRCVLASSKDLVFLDKTYYKNPDANHIQIFKYFGSIDFATANHFRRCLYKDVGWPKSSTPKLKTSNKAHSSTQEKSLSSWFSTFVNREIKHEVDIETKASPQEDAPIMQTVILDMSAVPYVDTVGINVLHIIDKDFSKDGTRLMCSNVHGHLQHLLARTSTNLPTTENFPTLEDGYVFAKSTS